MTTKERLEHMATVLATTEHSPDEGLRNAGLRLLAKELDDLDRCTRKQARYEVEEFKAYVTSNPSFRSVSLICNDSAKRVRKIMERD